MWSAIYISNIFNDYYIMKVHIYLPIFYILGKLFLFINNIQSDLQNIMHKRI